MSETENKISLTPRQMQWLSAYLDQSNSVTFLNASKSALFAGYKSSKDGYRVQKKCKTYILEFLNSEGLGEAELKAKLMQLMNAKERKIFSWAGVITDYMDVDNHPVQLAALKLAMQAQGIAESEATNNVVINITKYAEGDDGSPDSV